MKIDELFAVAGRSVVITGGASGFGLAIGSAMAANGADVSLLDIDGAAVEAAAASICADGGQAIGLQADVTDKTSLANAFEAVVKRAGGLDVVFVNAGISGGPGFVDLEGNRPEQNLIENQSNELWERVFATNVHGAMKTVQAAVPHMKKQERGGLRGKLVFTSSCSATKTENHVGSGYVASKAAVGHMVRQLARELAMYRITVNAISPGPAATNIAGGRLKTPEAGTGFGAQIPLGRIARPEDVTGAAIYLASGASDYMTGGEILIDGGFTLGATR